MQPQFLCNCLDLNKEYISEKSPTKLISLTNIKAKVQRQKLKHKIMIDCEKKSLRSSSKHSLSGSKQKYSRKNKQQDKDLLTKSHSYLNITNTQHNHASVTNHKKSLNKCFMQTPLINKTKNHLINQKTKSTSLQNISPLYFKQENNKKLLIYQKPELLSSINTKRQLGNSTQSIKINGKTLPSSLSSYPHTSVPSSLCKKTHTSNNYPKVFFNNNNQIKSNQINYKPSSYVVKNNNFLLVQEDRKSDNSQSCMIKSSNNEQKSRISQIPYKTTQSIPDEDESDNFSEVIFSGKMVKENRSAQTVKLSLKLCTQQDQQLKYLQNTDSVILLEEQQNTLIKQY